MINFNKEKNVKEYLEEYSSLEEYVLGKDINEKYIAKNKIAIIDCDGVITTGKSFYSQDGKSLKAYGCYDKEMLKFLAKNCNWDFLFVSDDQKGFNITSARLNDIGFPLVKASPDERRKIVEQYNSTDAITIFIGDSLSDIPALVEAKYNGTTCDAPDKVKKLCNYVSERKCGEGALAEILENLHMYLSKTVFKR